MIQDRHHLTISDCRFSYLLSPCYAEGELISLHCSRCPHHAFRNNGGASHHPCILKYGQPHGVAPTFQLIFESMSGPLSFRS
jgi:hypothetical protein